MNRSFVIDRTCYSFSRKSSRSRNIKGPILQYELRIHRLWRCPSCARTVRTRGNVSSRQCTCTDPMPFMSVVEEEPTPFDASKFVSYLTDELTTPTEKELLEDLPEWEGREAHRIKVKEKETRPRRGVGFLRAEPSTDTTESLTEDSLESEFGAGLDEAELKAIAAKNSERPKSNRPGPNRPRRDRSNRPPEARAGHSTGSNDGSSANEQKDGDNKIPGRKRRRRRGRRNRKDSTPTSGEPASAQPSVSAESSGADVVKPEESGGDQSNKSSGDKRKPRRRRRRGGRNRSSPGSGEGAAPATE